MKLTLTFAFAYIFLYSALIAQPHFVYPLRHSDNHRYLVDQNNKPFLLNGDTGWQIYNKLTTKEALEYLVARKAQGFNTILTQIATTPDDVNRYNQKPFNGTNDFSKPNEAYFDHIAEIIAKADSLGIFILMSQPWQSCCRDGWGMEPNRPIQKNGVKKNYDLGKYFGKKFGSLKNIMWIMGGDQDPIGDRLMIEAMAKGIYETAPHQLITYHAKPSHSSTDLYQYAPWLGVSMIYTYWREKPNEWVDSQQQIEIYEMALHEYNKTDTMPYILGESQYEGFTGNDLGTPEIVRRQPYWTLLSGGCGHAYGSEVYNFPAHWKDVLKYPGAYQMQHFYNFFDKLEWWRLIPDQKHKVVIKGYGEYTKSDYVTAALSDDSQLMVAYMHKPQTVTVDVSQIKSKAVLVEWFDPETGAYHRVGTFKDSKNLHFTPPSQKDWVLLMKGVK